ncbi:MAG: hypothetical protein IKP16_08085 [Prevotella sp.]|nr:hypothetical protein [Prevotella sp.]
MKLTEHNERVSEVSAIVDEQELMQRAQEAERDRWHKGSSQNNDSQQQERNTLQR